LVVVNFAEKALTKKGEEIARPSLYLCGWGTDTVCLNSGDLSTSEFCFGECLVSKQMDSTYSYSSTSSILTDHCVQELMAEILHYQKGKTLKMGR